MNNIVKNIKSINTKVIFDITYINIRQLIDILLMSEQNKLVNSDIKEFNDKQKVILNIFITQYVHLFKIISKYNKYIKIFKEDINILKYKPVFRGFFNAINILKSSKCKLIDIDILQIGILPTFLEAIYTINKSTRLHFIRVYSSKNESNHELYNNILNKFTNYNLISNLSNFYKMDIQSLLNDKSLLDKYDFIIFDTYKNMFNINLEDIQQNINQRLLLSLLNSKYILFQIIFALNKLKIDGNLILLLSGSNHLIYQQLITILSTLFEDILLINSEIDYSYRYFIVCKKFKPDLKIIKELTINISYDNILINLLDKSNKILDINFEKYLQIKFNKIRSDILYIDQLFNNQQLVEKIYNKYYYYQLNKTYNWTTITFNNSIINNEIYTKISKFKKLIFDKNIKKELNSFQIEIILEKNLNYLGIIVDTLTFNKMINYMNYLHLYDIINKNNDSNDKSIDISLLINKYKLDNPLYLEEINKLIFKNLKNQMILKFNFKSFCPFMLSVFYIFSVIYNKSFIVDLYGEYYYIFIDLDRQILLDNIINLYNLNMANITPDYQIVIINENYILQINKILNQLFITQLIDIIRFKFLSITNN